MSRSEYSGVAPVLAIVIFALALGVILIAPHLALLLHRFAAAVVR